AAFAGQSSVLFAPPAGLATVVAPADGLAAPQREALDAVRLVLSAGAPVHPQLLRQVSDLMPNARVHTPWGMTEGLLHTDIDG
ncbi:AMP-binding protein, partial [Micrococcus sp. GbtcB5]|uniref:AMP-binding protein n=1 Tax=Micrococcus sp. GbtcB5 TaxID=2824750 RepID=UPI001C30C4CD